ncbi:hypothetical protein [Spirosoma flavum]|uniref:Uncharacterized protein n=1 Tax=Spirosoma flavum TaxID=2048557 RepID=A0ABW6APU4_9BACT
MPGLDRHSGTADSIMPYNGGEVTLFGFASRGMALSAHATAEYFASRNGIAQNPVSQRLIHSEGPGTLPVDKHSWLRAKQPVVELYTVKGGGHVVPQAYFRFPRLNGPTATNVDTPTQAIAFFGLASQ